MVSAAIALMLALTWGGVRFPWLSWQMLGIVRGLGAAVGAVRLRGSRPRRSRSCRCRCCANPIVRTATLAGACCMGVLVGLTIFVPLYFETVIHLSASQSGLALIPLMGASVISATLTGRLDGAGRALQADGVWRLRGRRSWGSALWRSGRSDCRWPA